jgi:glucose/arabinose dehydrogenase
MAGRSSSRTWVAVFAAATLAGAGLTAAGPEPAAGQGATPQLKQIGGEFEAPVHVAAAPGAKKLLFVVEQPGVIRVLRKGRTLKRPFLDLGERVQYGGEEGLLSVAFDPGYAKNRRFFVYYVNDAGDLRVDSFKRKRKSSTRAELRSRRKVIEIPHPVNSNHNGGQLQFGPDGFLYLAPGDGGGGGDPNANAQNPESLLGKLLRIDPRRKRGYSSPASNPFAGGPGRDEIYSLGLRNPYRFSFDSRSGDLWIGDVGQNEWEEIDRASRETARGANFGWNLLEGNHEFEGDAGSPPANYVAPVHEYDRSGGVCAVTGGHVSRDPAVPALEGRYLYADYCVGDIRSLDAGAANPGASDASTGIEVENPSSFGEGLKGEIYVASHAGAVYRIVQR